MHFCVDCETCTDLFKWSRLLTYVSPLIGRDDSAEGIHTLEGQKTLQPFVREDKWYVNSGRRRMTIAFHLPQSRSRV